MWNEVISQLPLSAVNLLSTIAIAGRPIAWDLIHRATPEINTDDTSIIMLRKLHLIRTSGAGTSDQVEAYHDRIRQTVVSNMSEDDRRKRHLRLGELLEAEAVQQIEALAYHFYAAGEKAKACHYAQEGAFRARKSTAFEREAEYIARIIELEPPQEPEQALARYESLGTALVDAGKTAEGAAALLKASEYAPDLKSRSLKRQAGQYFLKSGRLEEGERLVSECLAAFGMTLPPTARESIINMIKTILKIKLRGGLEKFTERPEKEIPPEDLEKIDLCRAISAGSALGNESRTLDFQKRALYLALKAGEPRRIGRALVFEAGYLSAKNGITPAQSGRIIEKCIAIAKQNNDNEIIGYADFALGMTNYLCGKWSKSRHHLQKGNQVWRTRCTGMASDVTRGETHVIHDLHMLGEIREITRTLPSMLASATNCDDHWGMAALRTGFCISHWLALDDVKTATENCGDFRTKIRGKNALTISDAWDIQSNSYTAIYVQNAEWIESLASSFDAAIPAMRRGLLYVIQLVRIGLSDAVIRLSLAALSLGRKNAPYEKMIVRHIKKLRKEKQPYALGCATTGAAGLARHQGRAEDEHKHLAEAIKWFQEAEMALCEHACLWRFGELVGGDQGAQWQQKSVDWATGQAIAKPERLFRVFAPYDLAS